MDSKSGSAGAVASSSLSGYYNASQLRADTWNKLKATTGRLDKMAGTAAQQKKLLKAAEQAFDILGPIETYWAFPGIETFGSLRKLLEREEYGMLARAVCRIVRALMSGSYRRKHVALGLSVDDDREDDPLAEDLDSHDHVRPYFEILVVDDASPNDVRGLRAGLASMRRAEDSFIYEPVVVPSFEDGLIGVLFNHNIQAVVVRYGFPMHSRNRLELLQRYLNRLGDTDLDDIPPEEYGIQLAELIGRLRPELDVYLVTDQMVEDVAGRVTSNCRRVFYNQEDYMELHLNILRGVNYRYDTPFFTALKN